MVRTYNCSCNRNMYLWWCSNVYKRLQSFIWRYFYCAFLRFCLGIDSNLQPGVGKFWLDLTGMICPWAGNLIATFWKKSNPHPMPCLPPCRHYIDRCITLENDLLRFLPKACKKEICMQILKHHWLSTSCPSKLTPFNTY